MFPERAVVARSVGHGNVGPGSASHQAHACTPRRRRTTARLSLKTSFERARPDDPVGRDRWVAALRPSPRPSPRGEGVCFGPHPNPLPRGEGVCFGPHPGPLPGGEGVCFGPHPDPLPGGEGVFRRGLAGPLTSRAHFAPSRYRMFAPGARGKPEMWTRICGMLGGKGAAAGRGRRDRRFSPGFGGGTIAGAGRMHHMHDTRSASVQASRARLCGRRVRVCAWHGLCLALSHQECHHPKPRAPHAHYVNSRVERQKTKPARRIHAPRRLPWLKERVGRVLGTGVRGGVLRSRHLPPPTLWVTEVSCGDPGRGRGIHHGKQAGACEWS